jgi:hypothetical protein
MRLGFDRVSGIPEFENEPEVLEYVINSTQSKCASGSGINKVHSYYRQDRSNKRQQFPIVGMTNCFQ